MNMTPQTLVFLCIMAVIAFSLLAWIFRRPAKGKYKLRTFLTRNEKDCMTHLMKIFPDYHICPQVSMGAILEPLAQRQSANAKERSNNATHRNQVQSKVIDFVMLNAQLEPVFIIELDDNTHNSKQDLDRQRDFNLSQAGLKTVRIRRFKGGFPNRKHFEDALKAP